MTLIFLPISSLSPDIDECATGLADCDANAECNDTFGGFLCTCNSSYVGVGDTCIEEGKGCVGVWVWLWCVGVAMRLKWVLAGCDHVRVTMSGGFGQGVR